MPATRTFALLAFLSLAACDDPEPPPEAATRSVAVAAEAPAGNPAEFCDVLREDPPDFTPPELAEPLPAAAAGKWRWVNLWATWCAPCVEEMPRLQGWAEEHDFVLQPISADMDAATVTRFRGSHPDFPESARMADPGAVADYLGTLGLPGAGALPVQLLVDPQGKLRCIRAAGVSDEDEAHVRALLDS